jgi:hydrogenase maturation protein HypF
MSVAPAASRRRVRIRVAGTVQGVGFRPYVFRLATGLGLGGFVLNDEHGVLVEAEGDPAALEVFTTRLPREAPPLAAIEHVDVVTVPARAEPGFTILASEHAGQPDALVTPDTAICDECLAELFDPADRRFRYPFVNCTNCGPRFTIVRGVPYDRPLTTMAGFPMCAECRGEYDDPRDRRFHAQPNACPACGPAARLGDGGGGHVTLNGAQDDVEAAARSLLDGLIVAVKGIGGYHLACRADSERAVATLRSRKHREDKPFALMVPGLQSAEALVELGPDERMLLTDAARPIVIAPRLAGRMPVAPSVAPRSRELGVMLPYSPLHHLLLADAGVPLVMTSGNVSDEPIAYEDEEARERLGGIADRFLVHDRPIETRTDDSVLRAATVAGNRRALVLRRSRGYVPGNLGLPVAARRDVLACGAELKNTFCLAKGSRAWIGHHVGDLSNYETLVSFQEGISHFERLFAVAPAVVAHDLHPRYLSTAYALEREGVEPVGVQHHHAHLAACLAEHGITDRAVGAIYDGTGYGTDGTVWGGEVLLGDLRGFERVAHLHPVRMPGGEQAIREPWRMACAWLVEALDGLPGVPPALAASVDPARWEAVAELARGGLASPLTSSAGRLFDAVAALCGLRTRVNYEGQAATELEAVADPLERGAYPLPLSAGVLDPRETVAAAANDISAGVSAATVAARFHNALAQATAGACAQAAATHETATVVLSGGAFQNVLLLERTSDALAASGLRVLVPLRLPPNDGGISYGQAAVAASLT